MRGEVARKTVRPMCCHPGGVTVDGIEPERGRQN